MTKYTFETEGLGGILAAGLAIYGSFQGFDLAKDLTEYISLNSDYFNSFVKVTGAILGLGVGGLVGIVLGSHLPGGKVRKE